MKTYMKTYQKGFPPLESPTTPLGGDEYKPLSLFQERVGFKAPPFLTGFTLIEILVSIFIFSLVVIVASGVFISGLRAQKRSLQSSQLLNQTSYVLEYMSRYLRMARKELSELNPCLLNGKGYNYESNITQNSIRFLDYHNQCHEFFLDTSDNQLKERKSGDATPTHPDFLNPVDLTSDELRVTSFRVGLSGQFQSDVPPFQPRVTLFLEIEGGEGPTKPMLKIQTTISQRNLDVEEN